MDVHKYKEAGYPYVFRLSAYFIVPKIILIIFLTLISAGIIFINTVAGIVLLIISIFISKNYIKLIRNKYLIKLNSEGIWTKETDFQPWNNINKIYFEPSIPFVDTFSNNSIPVSFFIYLNNPKKKIIINISGLENQNALKELLVYFMTN